MDFYRFKSLVFAVFKGVKISNHHACKFEQCTWINRISWYESQGFRRASNKYEIIERDKNLSVTIGEWIDSGRDLPVLSETAMAVLNLLGDHNSTARQIGDLIKRDVSLSATILKFCNSSFYGFRKKINTLEQAFVTLGANSIRNITLSISVLNLISPSEKTNLLTIYKGSVLTGIAARTLARNTGFPRAEDTFTGGILTDIGLISMYKFDSENTISLINKMKQEARPAPAEEKDLFGLNHAEAGYLLAKKWNLPLDLSQAIRYHHNLNPENRDKSIQDYDLLKYVYLGSLVGEIFFCGGKKKNLERYSEGCRKILGMENEDSESVLQGINNQFLEVAEQFELEMDDSTSYEEMLQRANEELARGTLDNEASKIYLSQAFERERILAAQLTEANRKLHEKALRDGLTGLYNRLYFNEALKSEWQRAARNSHPLSLLMIDIDHFKEVNDNYGHQAGDMVLRKFSDTLNSLLRSSDLLARYGGEEFTIILPNTIMDKALVVAERVRMMVEKTKITLDGDTDLDVTVSCGVSTAVPGENGNDPDRLLKAADMGLYKAKKKGRNRVSAREMDSLS